MIEKLNDKMLHNQFALIGWSVTVCIIASAYLIEVIKGQRTLGYYLILLLCALAPLTIAWIWYKVRREDERIRFLAAYGYCILYAFVLLTGDTVLTFVYIFPLLTILVGYCDTVLLRNFAIINLIINIISVVIKIAVYRQRSADDIADYEIQVFAVLLCMIITYFSCRLIARINNNRLEILAAEEREAVNVLNAVVSTTDILSDSVNQIGEQARMISEQSESAHSAVEDIAAGTADVASKVQMQLAMSVGISEELEKLTTVSEELQSKFDETKHLSSEGIRSVDNLSQSTKVVAESKEQVSSATDSLLQKLAEAKEILLLINNITDQTTLLSLNASIEAARAGEQGKGFAVVAGEIQKLSGDTGDATDKISQILEALSQEADKVNHAVESLGAISDRQNSLVLETDEKFRAINDNIAAMTEAIRSQTTVLGAINHNNDDISGSISSMSDFTQSLTSNSEHTLSMTKQSMENTLEMNSLLGGIIGKVSELENAVRAK